MARRGKKNFNRNKVEKPLPKWVEIPQETGYYWMWCEDDEEVPPRLCSVEIMNHGIYILELGIEEEVELVQLPSKPYFCGPIEEPQSPYLTKGLSEYSVVGSTWAYDADRLVLRHLRNHTEIDLEQDCYSGWMVWLREQKWFYGYMEQELHEMCDKYAPREWMR